MEMYVKNEHSFTLKKEIRNTAFPVIGEVTAEQIEDIVVNALECQSNYWVGVDNTTPEWENKPQGLPVSQYAVQLLLQNKSVKLFDIEDEDEEWKLTLGKLLNGIGKAWAEGCDIEDDADTVLQYALFDKLVYG